jgi:hypothetical protein
MTSSCKRPRSIFRGNQAFTSNKGWSRPCNNRYFLTPLTIIHKSLSLRGQLHPRFDAKAWLPFKMAQGTVKWSLGLLYLVCLSLLYPSHVVIMNQCLSIGNLTFACLFVRLQWVSRPARARSITYSVGTFLAAVSVLFLAFINIW